MSRCIDDEHNIEDLKVSAFKRASNIHRFIAVSRGSEKSTPNHLVKEQGNRITI